MYKQMNERIFQIFGLVSEYQLRPIIRNY